MKTLCCLLLGLLLALNVRAETYGQPQLKEQQLVLADTSQIAMEIMAGQILAEAKSNFAGSVRLIWADEAFSSTASALRDRLISGGVAPDKVQLQPQSGGFNRQAVAGIQILIQRIILRLPECNGNLQTWHFDIYDDLGCALNNVRSSSLMTPYSFTF